MGLLVLGALPLVLGMSHGGPGPQTSGFSGSVPSVTPLADSGRYATLWPFSRDSIWNLPIGAGARYVPAGITRARDWGMTVDQDVIILTPDAPRTKVFYNDDTWSGASRCSIEGGSLFEAPIPPDFVVPPARPGWTPNFATAILAGDNRTLIQGQPMARCSPGSDATIWWSQTKEDLYGTGFSGGHGGSMLSSIGGTIRSGELVPGGAIRHAMKVNLDGWDNLYWNNSTWGFRWPASAADSCAPGCYHGKNPALRMGSLLALPPTVDIASMGLETEPAKIIARAFQDYGGYVVDNTGWSVYALSTEYSPQHGWLEDEFARAWGFPIDPADRDNPWARDMDRIFLGLDVVDNWDAGAWEAVRASNGTLGVGGGIPRVAWAADFAGAIPPPDRTPPQTWANLSGTIGLAPWYVTPVTVTLSASDDRSGVASIHIRVDGGPWSSYYWPMTISEEGKHTVEFYTTDIAGNDGSVEKIEFAVDTSGPQTTAVVTGDLGGDGWYRTPVTVVLNASDAGSGVASVEVRDDGGNWTPYQGPFRVSADGRHTVEYRATDALGNTGPPSNVNFLIDTQAPVVTHRVTGTLGSSGWYVTPISVALGPAGAPGSLSYVAYSLDGAGWNAYTGPFVVDEGRHTLSYQAHYAYGNLGPIESIELNVDRTAPTVVRTGASDPIAPDSTISWTATDAGSGIVGYEVSLDGAPFVDVGTATTASGPWSTGDHVLVVRATDAAGNVGDVTIRFRVDMNVPRITPKVPAGGNHRSLDLVRTLIVVGTVGGIVALLLRGPIRSYRGGRVKGSRTPPSGPTAKPAETTGVAPKAPEGLPKGDVVESPPEGAVKPSETAGETAGEGTPKPPQDNPTEPSTERPPEPPGEVPKEAPQGPEAPAKPPEGPVEQAAAVPVEPTAAAPDPGSGEAPKDTAKPIRPGSIEYLMEVPREP
jgi:hypothetical protein